MTNFLISRRAEARAYLALVTIVVLASVLPLIYHNPDRDFLNVNIQYYSSTPCNPGSSVQGERRPQTEPLDISSTRYDREANGHKFRSRQTPGKGADEAFREKKGPVTGFHPCNTFDPNTISADSLVAWGVRPMIAANFVKYRQSEGKYRSAEEIGKVYGISAREIDMIIDCIEIENTLSIDIIDINLADSTQWTFLPGIGKTFARRILKFREALGGFTSTHQVAETYGLPPETFSRISPYLVCSTPHVKLNINTADAEDLGKHPYISRKQAEVIVNYRQLHGPFDSENDLGKLHIADSSWIMKISPYLIY